MLPSYYLYARQFEGIKELPTKRRNNKTILGFYETVGHSWVDNDEVAWCAAFVGHCLMENGYPSTPKKVALTARSYETYGDLVYGKIKKNGRTIINGSLTAAQEGDICVFKRGNSSWQGHVAFYVRQTANYIYVLGGNQSNAVNVKRYAKSKLLAIRRPVERESEPQIEMHPAKNKPPVLPREDRQPLANSMTLKGLFGAVTTMAAAFINQLQSMHWSTQILLVLTLAFMALAAWRRIDANRKGKVG